MKAALKILVRVMAVAGWACIALALFSIFEPMDSKARRYFSDKDRVETMISLFHKLDAANPSALGLIELDEAEIGLGIPKPWKLPRSMVPDILQQYRPGTDTPFATTSFGCVLVHYDKAGALAAVEFYGSRIGGFVCRDSTATLPSRPGSRIPIRTSPLWITARAHGD